MEDPKTDPKTISYLNYHRLYSKAHYWKNKDKINQKRLHKFECPICTKFYKKPVYMTLDKKKYHNTKTNKHQKALQSCVLRV